MKKGTKCARFEKYSIIMPVAKYVTNKEEIIRARGAHSQQYIADALGVCRSTVQNWEYGITRMPMVAMIALNHLKQPDPKPKKFSVADKNKFGAEIFGDA